MKDIQGKSIRIFSPATVANVGCGFDVLGFALEGVGDEMVLAPKESPTLNVTRIEGCEGLPYDADKNVATVALKALLEAYGKKIGFDITIKKNVLPGSGLGSSASSSAGAVFAANELLGRPFTREQLVVFAMEGERVASLKPHADNVAPAIFGGFTLVRDVASMDVINIRFPSELHVTIAHPQVEVKTADAKKILRKEVLLSDAITQWANVGSLVAGLMSNDYGLIGRSLKDVIVEPVRSMLIPLFQEAKTAAMEAGALGFSISGSGPSVFALSTDRKTAEDIKNAIASIYAQEDIDTKLYISKINPNGCEVIESQEPAFSH